jgi:hypothetical protein
LVNDIMLAPTTCDVPLAKGVMLVPEPARAVMGMTWERPDAWGDL